MMERVSVGDPQDLAPEGIEAETEVVEDGRVLTKAQQEKCIYGKEDFNFCQ